MVGQFTPVTRASIPKSGARRTCAVTSAVGMRILTRDAAPVDAGSAEGTGLDQQRHGTLPRILGHHDAARAGTNDDQREVRYLPNATAEMNR